MILVPGVTFRDGCVPLAPSPPVDRAAQRTADHGTYSTRMSRERRSRVDDTERSTGARLAGLVPRVPVLVALLVVGLGVVGTGATSAQQGSSGAPRDLDEAVRRFHDPHGSAASCAAQPAVSGEARWRCSATECPGACQVVERVTVIGERNGRFRRVSQERLHRGDTGACGCCMHVGF